jgi:hypothetical protein
MKRGVRGGKAERVSGANPSTENWQLKLLLVHKKQIPPLRSERQAEQNGYQLPFRKKERSTESIQAGARKYVTTSRGRYRHRPRWDF